MSKTNAELQTELNEANARIKELEKDGNQPDPDIWIKRTDSAQQLKDLAKSAEGQIDKLKSDFQAELDKATARIKELEADTGENLRVELDAANVLLAANQRKLEKALAAAGGDEYKFVKPVEAQPREIFDSLKHGPEHGWLLHERMYMTHDTGYSTGIPDRAIAVVQRAFALERMGPNYEMLPKFHRQNVLEVIVRIVPHEEDAS